MIERLKSDRVVTLKDATSQMKPVVFKTQIYRLQGRQFDGPGNGHVDVSLPDIETAGDPKT
ncbi:hypothetical protein IWQ55_000274 [Labrenzia sp. EL_208]|nr:hypothetical protein [Labrenzia sp. EL_132]MBG6227082.1 hypothetical protein [Labrenzia sp. EL_208]